MYRTAVGRVKHVAISTAAFYCKACDAYFDSEVCPTCGKKAKVVRGKLRKDTDSKSD